MPQLHLTLTLSGRPLVCARVRIDGHPESMETDRTGALEVDLPHGRHAATATVDERELPLTIVHAPGLRRVRVDLREPEIPLDNPRVREAMPSERYIPLRLLGRGAAGSVYRCRDVTLDRLVAIKILNEDLISSDAERREFIEEGRNLARIEHPNLIRIHDLGIHGGRAYMVVQYVDGPNLESCIAAEGRLDPGAVAASGVQLMRGLDALHSHGLIHRDVKPSNGLVSRDGRVWLADFGLVRPLVDFTDPRSRIFGTPAYMSPEQLQAEALGPATDIYALGASLYHLAAGELPFTGANPIVAHLVEPAPDLRTLVPDAPEELAELLRAMMAKAPADRPDAETVIDTLLPLATAFEPSQDAEYTPRLISSEQPSLRLTAPHAHVSATHNAPSVPSTTRAVESTSPTARATVPPAGRDALHDLGAGPERAHRTLQRRAAALVGVTVITTGVALWTWLRADEPSPEPANDPPVAIADPPVADESPDEEDLPTLSPDPARPADAIPPEAVADAARSATAQALQTTWRVEHEIVPRASAAPDATDVNAENERTVAPPATEAPPSGRRTAREGRDRDPENTEAEESEASEETAATRDDENPAGPARDETTPETGDDDATVDAAPTDPTPSEEPEAELPLPVEPPPVRPAVEPPPEPEPEPTPTPRDPEPEPPRPPVGF